jgi:peptidoglycan hydrolase-like protein with peptidoglycan-binding domain
MTTVDYEVRSAERSRHHRAPSRRRPLAPLAIGGLALITAVVITVDAFNNGGGGPSAIATVTDQNDDSASAESSVTTPAEGSLAALAAVDAAAGAAVADPSLPQVDLDGCTLDVLAVQVGSDGDAVTCVQKALTALGYYTGAVDGVFSDSVGTAATAFQTDNDLYVDGVVGRQTAEALGIWPGDESFVVRTPKPPAGATDLWGMALSSVASAGPAAPELPADAGQGTGYRIVYSRLAQRVWAVDDQERIVRSYLVSGSQYNNEVPGEHEVYSRSETTTAWNGQATLPLMVRWLDTVRGAIGFHQIPRHNSDGTLYQTDDELGTRLSGGCQRQTALDAQFMWAFGQIGTKVIVL